MWGWDSAIPDPRPLLLLPPLTPLPLRRPLLVLLPLWGRLRVCTRGGHTMVLQLIGAEAYECHTMVLQLIWAKSVTLHAAAASNLLQDSLYLYTFNGQQSCTRSTGGQYSCTRVQRGDKTIL